MNTFLLTRPKEDNDALTEKLKALGFHVIISPLLAIHYNRHLKDDAGFASKAQAIIVTSRNAIRALHQAGVTVEKPFYVVGQSTADLATNLGYNVIVAGEDVESLSQYITHKLSPKLGDLAYFSGQETSRDLKTLLPQFSISEIIAYEAKAIGGLSDEAANGIREKRVDNVICLSVRSANMLISALKKHGLEHSLDHIICYALSPHIANAAKAVRWNNIVTSPSPSLQKLLSLLKKT